MNIIYPDKPSPRRSHRRRIYMLLAVIAIGLLGYWFYPRDVATMATLDGERRWSLADGPPRRHVIWEKATPLAGPELPAEVERTLVRPSLADHGRVLYFSARASDHTMDIYQSHLVDGNWQPAVPVTSLNSEADDIGATVSTDGTTLFLYSNRDGGHGGFDIYQSSLSNGSWAKPVNLGSSINTPADECEPTVNPAGTSLYFSSDHSANMPQQNPGESNSNTSQRWKSTLRSAIGFNRFNLFRARRDQGDSAWDKARPLNSLNRSDANDGAPRVDATGAFLYFSSDRPHRPGESRNLDIYRVRIRETGHGDAENLGRGVNTRDHELEPVLTLQGFQLYFSRESSERESADIPAYDLYSSTAVEVEIQRGKDDQRLQAFTAFLRSSLFKLVATFRNHAWWIGLVLLVAGLLAGLAWYLRRMSFQRASVPVFFVWALAIHLILGAGSFYIYFDSELLDSVKKTFKSILVASKLPSDELHQSHKPGQEAYEKVADLKSLETVQTSDIARQVIESPNMAVATDSAIPSLPARSQLSVQAVPRARIEAIPTEPVREITPVDRKSQVPEAIAENTVTIEEPLQPAETIAQLRRPTTDTGLPRQPARQPELPSVQVALATPDAVAAAPQNTPEPLSNPDPEPARNQPDPSPLDRQSPRPIDDNQATQVSSLKLPPPPVEIPRQRPVPTAAMNLERTEPVLVLAPPDVAKPLQATQAMVRLDASRQFERQVRKEDGPQTVITQANYETAQLLKRASPAAAANTPRRSQAQLFENPPQNQPAPQPAPLPSQKVLQPRRDTTTVPEPQPLDRPQRDGAKPTPQLISPADRGTLPKAAPPTPAIETAIARVESIKAASPAEAVLSKVPTALPEATPTSDPSAMPATATVTTSRVETPSIDVPLNDAVDRGGPLRPSTTRVVIGSIGRQVVDAPITVSPHATALLRLPARAPEILYAEDNIGLQALLRLRNVDLEAKRELVKVFGGSEETLETVNRSLQWIVSQQHEDGHWAFNKLREIDGKAPTQAGGTNAEAAATAFGLLPLLGNGNTHQKGPYKDHVQRGVQWLLKTQQGSGEFKRPGTTNARMYSHGVASIALCEAYAMSGDAALKVPAQKAIDFIVKSQHKTLGGWRYQPGDSPDTSVVGWQVMAIKSAQMANLAVPSETLDGVRTWLDRVAGKGNKLGQFGYASPSDLKPTMSAEALLCHQYLDMPRHDPTLEAGARYLKTVLPRPRKESSYYWYYGTQVMFHLQGDDWNTWNQAMKPLLLNTQVKEGHEAGSWPPEDQWDRPGGRLLATSLRVLILEVYFRHLPLYKVAE